MKCPKCGNELSEGKLLCEHCGEEVKYVPDFDIELEHELGQSISVIIEELSDDADEKELVQADNKAADTNAIFDADDELKDRLSDYFPKKKIDFFNNRKIRTIAITTVILIAAVFALLIGFNALVAKREDSYGYQYEMAQKAVSDNRYADAVSYLERAVALDASNIDTRLLLAECYGRNGMRTSEIYALIELIEQNPEYPRRDRAYDRLLAIYEEDKNYDEIVKVLADCDVEMIVSKYNKYAAHPPKFNKEGGEYDEIISIALSGNADGAVYYTMDGTKPTVRSFAYETPILLESGDYIINAVFVNEYGITSDMASQSYTITLPMPEGPVVSADSGTYKEPVLIEVFHKDNTKVYYTLDGSVPDKNSTRYSSPIEMPCGISRFSFVAIDESGVKSEIVSRNYDLKIEANFDMDTALLVLKNNLAVLGKLADSAGDASDAAGGVQYRIRTAVRINESLYYVVYEEYVDNAGRVQDIDDIYAIDAETAQLYYAYKIDEGEYNLKPFDE